MALHPSLLERVGARASLAPNTHLRQNINKYPHVITKSFCAGPYDAVAGRLQHKPAGESHKTATKGNLRKVNLQTPSEVAVPL
jgi:hypothetical protein